MRSKIRWNDAEEAVAAIIGPLKQVRALRQGPAHKVEADKFSQDYDAQQHDIVRGVYASLMHLRRTLAKHPKAPKIEIPDWISEGRIAFA